MKFAELSLPALDLPRQARSHPIAATDGADQRATMLELAQEFEAMFLLQMLKQMRQSMFDDEAEGGSSGPGRTR